MRVRSKQELLANLRVYEAMRNDCDKGTNYRGNTAFWRLGVEWAEVAWKEFKLSTPEISRLIEHANAEVDSLTEKRREEIRERIAAKGCDWVLKNMADRYTQCRNNNIIDQAIKELEYHNTQVAVDYSLLAIEYLIINKQFGKKRLDKAIGDIYYLDALPASKIWDFRWELYQKKNIWLQLYDETPENCPESDFDEYAAEVFQS